MPALMALSLALAAAAAPPSLPIESRVGDGASPWRRETAIEPLKGESVTLRVAAPAGATVRWYRIYPDLMHFYKNANHPWEASPYAWVGWATLPYAREELTQFRDQREMQPIGPQGEVCRDTSESALDPHPTRAPHYRADAGSFWFQVEVERGGVVTRSYGIEDATERGLHPKVFRLSIRDGAGYLGFLTSFHNVPGLFGSVPYQAGNYIGVDCADVLMAAHSRFKRTTLTHDYNVAALVAGQKVVARFTIAAGAPDRSVPLGAEIAPGDLIAVRYAGASQYGHIGAIYQDSNGNGVLDADDLVLHAGPDALHTSPLREGGFDGEVAVLRLR